MQAATQPQVSMEPAGAIPWMEPCSIPWCDPLLFLFLFLFLCREAGRGTARVSLACTPLPRSATMTISARRIAKTRFMIYG